MTRQSLYSLAVVIFLSIIQHTIGSGNSPEFFTTTLCDICRFLKLFTTVCSIKGMSVEVDTPGTTVDLKSLQFYTFVPRKQFFREFQESLRAFSGLIRLLFSAISNGTRNTHHG